MLKTRKLFLIVLCQAALWAVPKGAAAELILELWMTVEQQDTDLVIEVHRANTDFGLGGLSYNLEFSETVETSREYSDYGWVANDGFWDNSNPLDGAVAVSLDSARFDTVVDPATSEFPESTSGTVEVLTLTNIAPAPPRWIFVDILGPAASDGPGNDLVAELGGTISVIPQQGLPEPHTLGIFVPEPGTLILFGLAGVFLLKRRRK